MKHLMIAIAVTILTACQGDGLNYAADESYSRLDIAAAPPPAPQMMRDAKMSGSSEASPDTPNAPTESFLAYRYNYGFELPNAAVKSVMESHMQRCMAAGPNLCQVLSSSSQTYSEDNTNAQLSFRADPGFLDGFATEIQASVTDANGELTSSSINVEDLTRQILDTDARLNAQTALRDRLQNLLENREAELGDLLSVERELARVQGEIESATSILKALRQRVSMSRVDINYSTKPRAVTRSAFAPVGRALRDFAGNVSSGLAGVINFIAITLPWFILLLLPLTLLIRWIRRRRKTDKAPKTAKT